MKLIKFFSLALLASATTFSLAACDNDPDHPEKEHEHKHHDKPVKAVITFTPGTFTKANAFDNAPTLADFIPAKDAAKVVYTMEAAHDEEHEHDHEHGHQHDEHHEADEHHHEHEHAWHITTTSEGKAVKGYNTATPYVYLLEIEYFNAHGESMNGEFFEEGQDKVHQHFFSVFANNHRVKDKTQLGFDYRYADVSPKGIFLGEKNPIGLKGFMKFDGSRKNFDLNIQLMHAGLTKYLSNGQTAPFFAPTDQQIQKEDWEDFSVKLPIVVE